ncbi:hypothetical protein HAX54_033321 [Datura stramonium]|uniref:Uncharacterized protein n=1 Tax=Datura stramonium TaxID=4076 RepID=A0ABS8SDD5_DATST|nr:hypothetical protein [Datura stramonium]
MGPSLSNQKHGAPLRLCSYFQGDNLAEWSLTSKVLSLHFMKSRRIALSSIGRASYTFNSLKFLRVLDLEFTVIDSFPEALTCLRYVAVRIAEDSSLSFSKIAGTFETLIVKGIGGRVSLPDTIWKMVKLRHLHIYNPWFSRVEDAENIFRKISNLQKLRCEVSKRFPAFNNLTKLEMLKFSGGPLWSWASDLNLPPSLKKLTLSNCWVSSLDQVATLPRLVVLKLLQVIITSKVMGSGPMSSSFTSNS